MIRMLGLNCRLAVASLASAFEQSAPLPLTRNSLPPCWKQSQGGDEKPFLILPPYFVFPYSSPPWAAVYKAEGLSES